MEFYIDLTEFNQAAQDPLAFVWFVFKNGGWIVFTIILLWGLFHFYMNYIQDKYAATKQWIVLAINIPEQSEQSPKAVENIFSQLWGSYADPNLIEKYIEGVTQESFSFEIASTDGYIQYYVRTNVVFRDFIESIFYAQYPDAEIVEVPDYTQGFPDKFPNDEYKMWGTEFKMNNKDYVPIRTYQFFEHSLSQELKDPIAAVLEILGKMKKGEHAWIQFVLKPISDSWKNAGTLAIKKMLGHEVKTNAFIDKMHDSILGTIELVNEQIFGSIEGGAKSDKGLDLGTLKMSPGQIELMKAIESKISKLGFQVKFRMIYLARPEIFSKPKGVAGIVGAFQQFNDTQKNGFRPHGKTMTKANYFMVDKRVATRQEKLMRAYRGRSGWAGGGEGFVLNIEELASLYHFPSFEIKAPRLKRTPARRAGAPVTLPTEEMEEVPHLVEEVKEVPLEQVAEPELKTLEPSPVMVKVEEEGMKTKKKKHESKTLNAPPNLPI